MLQRFKDWMYGVWDQRFMFGASVTGGSVSVVRYSNGVCLFKVEGPGLHSVGTGHWPAFLFEGGVMSDRSSWHVGLLGWTIGKMMVPDLQPKEDGKSMEIVGPDKPKYYGFFKFINHKAKQLEEII